MKLFCALALLAASSPAVVSQQLKQVNTVYILAMTSGMDQYLANRLTTLGVFQVVADPQESRRHHYRSARRAASLDRRLPRALTILG